MGRADQSAAAALSSWLDWVGQLSGRPVASHPEPGELGRGGGQFYYYRPGEVVVRHGTEDALETVVQALQNAGAVVPPDQRQRATRLPVTLLRLAPGSPSVPELLARVQTARPDLQRVVAPNYVGFTALVLNGAPWVNGGPGGAPETVLSPNDKPASTTNQAPGAKLLVFDTGVLVSTTPPQQPTDPWPWMATVTGPAEEPLDPNNMSAHDLFDCHGLFVAGVAASAMPGGTITVVDVFDNAGAADDFQLGQTMSSTLDNNPGVRVANFSGGIYAPSNPVPLTLEETINKHPNVLFVAAGGNLAPGAPSGHFYPAALGGTHKNVVGVGALTAANTKASFSNNDPDSCHVWARGAEVINAFVAGSVQMPAGLPPVPDVKPNGKHTAKWSGTSFAAPLVAAMMARYMTTAGATANRDAAVNSLKASGWASVGALTVIKMPVP